MTVYKLELYVAGDAPSSRTAVRLLTALCEQRLEGRYELDVVDVLAHPEKAERARILATPTVLRLSPTPRVRIVGDLSLTAKVLDGLGLNDEMDPEIGESRQA